MELLFFFKKVVSRLFFPVPLLFYPLLLGALLVWFSKMNRGQRQGRILIALGLVLFFLFSAGPLPSLLLRTLESRYEIYAASRFEAALGAGWEPEFIVVLAGDSRPYPELPPSLRLGPSTTQRLAEGVRLHGIYPESLLVFTGGKMREKVPALSTDMKSLAASWGVPADLILTETESRDTKDHVRYLADILGNEPFLLVTSASHLPRAMALFEGAGLQPVPAPAAFSGGKDEDFWKDNFRPRNFIPSAGHFSKMETVFYEYMGLIWAKLRDQI